MTGHKKHAHTLRALRELVKTVSTSGFSDGILLLGSFGKDKQSPASDIDLLIILRKFSAVPFMVSGILGGRVADVIVVSGEMLRDIRSVKRAAASPLHLWIADWLKQGKILYDPHGKLSSLRNHVCARKLKPGQGEPAAHQYWYSMNFNLRHNNRMRPVRDDVTRTALQLRMLYSIFETLLTYFRLRGIPWKGEKTAIRYLAKTNPSFLARLRRALWGARFKSSYRAYAGLVRSAGSRRWRSWTKGTTAFQLMDDTYPTKGRIQTCRKYWNRLMRGGGPGKDMIASRIQE